MRDIAFSCDDNGTRFLEVAVWSLLDKYRGEEPIRVNVFEGWGGHSEESKSKLKLIIDTCNSRLSSPLFSLRYHNVEKFIEPYKDLLIDRAGSRWNIFTWTPVFTPQILPDATGNVIHFDIDMLINADVSELFEMEVPLFASTYEYDIYGDNAGKIVWEKGILPRTAERYFNTGTLVMNAAACRAELTWEKILAWYRDHYGIADRIEQDAWNALYWRRTRLLPLRWNFHDRLMKRYPKLDPSAEYWQGNPPKECLEAALDPAILHFWGPKKPWKPCHRHYRRLYHDAMRAVGEVPPGEPLLAPYYNLINRLNLLKIKRMANVA